MFTPKIGEDEPILTSIFFRWVGEKPPTSNGRVVVSGPPKSSAGQLAEGQRGGKTCFTMCCCWHLGGEFVDVENYLPEKTNERPLKKHWLEDVFPIEIVPF